MSYSKKRNLLDKTRGIISVESITPLIVCDFLDEFIIKINPKNILDPVAGSGLAIVGMAEKIGDKAKITAIDINAETMEECKKYTSTKNIEYILGDAIEILPKIDEKFDLIFGDLPWGVRVKKSFFNIKVSGDIVILLQSLMKLNEGGYAIFTNPDSFFLHTYENIKFFLDKMGVSLIGSIKLPAGTYYPKTGIQSNLIIFQKKPQIDTIFLGELLGNNSGISEENNSSGLVDNFFTKKGSGDFIGKNLHRNDIKSYLWDKQKSYEKIDKLLLQKKIKKIDGCVISGKINLEISNSVYITTLGFPKIKLGFDDDETKKIKDKKAKYIQIVLPSGYDPEIFYYFYNGSFGKTHFGCLVSGIMNNLSLSSLNASGLYYPEKGIEKIKKIFDKIDSIKHIVADVDQTLKYDFFAIDEVYETISKIDIMSDIEYVIKDFPTIIAKLYKEYKDTKTKEEYHDAFDYIDHIFTATSIFCISIMLAGLKRNTLFFEEIKDDIVKSVRNFSKLSLGDLYYMYGNIANKIKQKLNSGNDGREFILGLFGAEDSVILDSLTDKQVYEQINVFLGLRNKYSGHKGKIDNVVYKEILHEAESVLHKFILGLSQLKNVKLILGSDKSSRIDEYAYIVTLTIFNGYLPYTEKITLSESPIVGKLYFTMGSTGTIILLPDLIKYDTSTSDKTKIPYFYNRVEKGEIEYVTYDIAEKERKTYPMSGINDTFLKQLLSAPSRTDD